MRVAVIRNDLPAPLLLADLEQVSRRNSSVDAPGQVRYLGVATVATIEAALGSSTGGVGATIRGSALTFNVTINGTNDVLELRTSATGTFVAYTIAQATYTNITDLIAALNTAFGSSGIVAFNIGNAIVLESPTKGVTSYLENDTIAGGSTANTILGFANGAARNMPAATAFLTAAGIPGGPVDVSQATLEAVGATTNSRALEPFYDASDARATVVADAIAPVFAETDVAVESFLVGMISEYHNASYNPDTRNPASVTSAAVDVVEDDGSTAFETANTLPTVTSATLDSPSAGDVTIAGTGLGKETGDATNRLRSTTVRFTGDVTVTLYQERIEGAGGSVSDTTIVIPASLIPGAATTTTSVQVQFRQRVSAVEALA